jgi:ABC-2 type transport system ATP-binding protein
VICLNAVETFNLRKTYDGNKNALNDTSFSVGQGEIFGFLGPNGAGKTTTIRLLNGILEPSAGRAAVMGKDIAKEQVDIHKICGVMTETAFMYENLSGMDNLMFFGSLHGMTDTASRERSLVLLKSLELLDARDRKVKAYSTGMKSVYHWPVHYCTIQRFYFLMNLLPDWIPKQQ